MQYTWHTSRLEAKSASLATHCSFVLVCPNRLLMGYNHVSQMHARLTQTVTEKSVVRRNIPFVIGRDWRAYQNGVI